MNKKKVGIGCGATIGILALIGACGIIADTNKSQPTPATTTTTAQSKPDYIDTGIHGIQMPPDAKDIQSSDHLWLGKYPGKKFEEVAEWVGPRLPEQIDDMPLVLAGRAGKDRDLGHEWCYEKASGDAFKMVYVLVSADSSVTVQSADNDVVGCQAD